MGLIFFRSGPFSEMARIFLKRGVFGITAARRIEELERWTRNLLTVTKYRTDVEGAQETNQ